jgi:hypothetical protein
MHKACQLSGRRPKQQQIDIINNNQPDPAPPELWNLILRAGPAAGIFSSQVDKQGRQKVVLGWKNCQIEIVLQCG